MDPFCQWRLGSLLSQREANYSGSLFCGLLGLERNQCHSDILHGLPEGDSFDRGALFFWLRSFEVVGDIPFDHFVVKREELLFQE